MKNEFKVRIYEFINCKINFCIIELIKEAERVRQTGSRNFKEKIYIYHEAAEACRSLGNSPQE
jgi:hypothetical protein